jgi:hypothetical protein
MEAVSKLQARVRGFTKARFVTYVRWPVLVARAVVGGKVERSAPQSGAGAPHRGLVAVTHVHLELDGSAMAMMEQPKDDLLVTHPLSRPLWVEIKKSAHTPPNQAVALGRSNDRCDVVLNDYTVSKVHAALGGDTARGMFRLMDLGSTNGTIVDGVALEPRQAADVLSGQTVQIGRLVLEILTPEDFYDDLFGYRAAPRSFDLELSR